MEPYDLYEPSIGSQSQSEPAQVVVQSTKEARSASFFSFLTSLLPVVTTIAIIGTIVYLVVHENSSLEISALIAPFKELGSLPRAQALESINLFTGFLSLTLVLSGALLEKVVALLVRVMERSGIFGTSATSGTGAVHVAEFPLQSGMICTIIFMMLSVFIVVTLS